METQLILPTKDDDAQTTDTSRLLKKTTLLPTP